MAALLTGFVLGMGRLAAEIGKGSLDGFLFYYADINFLHFAVLLFAICTIVLVTVSLLTPPPPAEQIAGLTFADRTPVEARSTEAAWRRKDLVLTFVLILGVAAVWLYF